MDINAIDAKSNDKAKNDEIEARCESMKLKIIKRIQKLVLEKEQSARTQQQTAAKAEEELNRPVENVWGEFSGDLYTWHNFKNKFKMAIHDNARLDDVAKLSYLKLACKEAASNIVTDASDNYEQAWKQLNNVFGESYAQLHFCIHRLSNIPAIDNASAKSLRKVMNVGNDCMEILKEIMLDEKCDHIITVMLTNKLDQDTARAWDRHRLTLAMSWIAGKADTEMREQSMHIPSIEKMKKKFKPNFVW